jgi:hypothetical protein
MEGVSLEGETLNCKMQTFPKCIGRTPQINRSQSRTSIEKGSQKHTGLLTGLGAKDPLVYVLVHGATAKAGVGRG